MADDVSRTTQQLAESLQDATPAARDAIMRSHLNTHYIYSIDPAHGPDKNMEVLFERMPDGRLRMVDRGEVIKGEIVK